MLYVLFLFSLQHFYVILFLLLFAFQIIGQLDNMFIQNFQKFANKMRFKNVIKCKLSRTLYNNNDNSMTPQILRMLRSEYRTKQRRNHVHEHGFETIKK